MQVSGNKGHQRVLKQKLRQEKQATRLVEKPMLDKVEVITWIQRLMALQEYRDNGSSAIITRDAERLQLSEEEVIQTYYKRMNAIKNPLWYVMADDLVGNPPVNEEDNNG